LFENFIQIFLFESGTKLFLFQILLLFVLFPTT